MRIGITMEENSGIEGDVALHFGQCRYFFIVDIEDGKITSTRIESNEHTHGGGNCTAVDGLMEHNITHIISGGMGAGAQQKFARAGIKVSGYRGKVKDAISNHLANSLSGLEACKDHDECH
jgi:predicted Fe-Mo cluster-binding NifX family protein